MLLVEPNAAVQRGTFGGRAAFPLAPIAAGRYDSSSESSRVLEMSAFTPEAAAEQLSEQAASLAADNLIALHDELFPDEPVGVWEPGEDLFDVADRVLEPMQEFLAGLADDPERIPEVWPSLFPMRQPVEFDDETGLITVDEVMPAGRR